LRTLCLLLLLLLLLCRLGLKIAIADIDAEALREFGVGLAAEVGEANVLVVPTDVGKLEEVVRLRDRVYEAWGEVRSFASQRTGDMVAL
jgi:hypothetical protein